MLHHVPLSLSADHDVQSVIFDCCHSASGTRAHSKGHVPRTVELGHTIPEDLDEDIWGRAGKIAPGFAYHGLQSHILLAACGENEFAYEHDGRGQFTTGLLKTLKNGTIDDLTYTEVLGRIHLNGYEYYCPYNECDTDSSQSIQAESSLRGMQPASYHIRRESAWWQAGSPLCPHRRR